MHHRQAHTGSFPFVLSGEVRFEYLTLKFFRNADTLIFNGYFYVPQYRCASCEGVLLEVEDIDASPEEESLLVIVVGTFFTLGFCDDFF